MFTSTHAMRYKQTDAVVLGIIS